MARNFRIRELTPAEPLGDDVGFGRFGAAGGGLGVPDRGEQAFQVPNQGVFGAALEYLGDEHGVEAVLFQLTTG